MITCLVLLLAVPSIAAEQVILKLGHIVQETHSYHQGALKFKEIVEEKTNKKVIVKLYPGKLLGNERDLAEGLQLGTVDMAIVSAAVMQNFESMFGLINLPYIFEGWDQAEKVITGPVIDEMFSRLAKKVF